MKMIYITALVLLVSSCVSSQSVDSSIVQTLKKISEEKNPSSIDGFKKLCAQGHLISCQWAERKSIDIKPVLSILQGATDSSSVQINVLSKKGVNNTFWLYDSVDVKIMAPSSVETSSREGSDWVVYNLVFKNLKTEKSYRFEVLDSEGILVDSRGLASWTPRPRNLRVAVVSCLSDVFKNEQKIMWQNLAQQHPEVIFLIGDNVYADHNQAGEKVSDVNPDWIWQRYAENRELLELYKFKNLIPIYAMWDDHDYGKNDGGEEFVHKIESLEIFKSFFPLKDNSLLKWSGYGLSYKLKLAGQSFYFLDDRSFRSEKNSKSLKKTHFGPNQEKWLFDNLDADSSPSWLISGDQFFGKYHNFDSYEGYHPESFEKFLNFLKQKKNRVVFVSGDRHLAELMKVTELGYTTYELTSSGMHAKVFPGAFEREKNPRRIGGVDGKFNFMIVESHKMKKGMMLNVSIFSEVPDALQTKNLLIQ